MAIYNTNLENISSGGSINYYGIYGTNEPQHTPDPVYMKWEYTTIQGDTWDVLARDIYGSEKLAYVILMENPAYMHYIYLPAGLKLIIPQTPKSKIQSARPTPPWVKK